MLGWKKEEKKKQSIKPSNDKYGIALSSEYYSRSLRMLGRLLGMKRRSLFVCKWEIDYIYLLAEGLVVETRTHTQRRARSPPPPPPPPAPPIERPVIAQLFLPPL